MGMRPGVAHIKAKLSEPEFKDVAPATYSMMVVEPFLIYPSYPVPILPNSKFLFKLYKKNFQEGEG